jgi:hypothetical protein
MNATAPRFVGNRDRLAQIAHRKVRIVASESNEFAEALFAILRERFPSPRIDYREWEAALAELDASDLTIGEFLELENNK